MNYLLFVFYCLVPAAVSLVAVTLEIKPFISYPIGKTFMVVLPVLVWILSKKSLKDIAVSAGIKKTYGIPGLALGLVMSAAILAGFYVFFKDFIDPVLVRAKVNSLGIMSYYWAAAVYFSLGNALLEEYYFRSFLVDRTRALQISASPWVIAGLNGLAFGVHHFAVLFTLVPIGQCVFFTLGTVTAGCIWAYARARGVSIWDCYISHIMADLAIFWAAWQVIHQGTV